MPKQLPETEMDSRNLKLVQESFIRLLPTNGALSESVVAEFSQLAAGTISLERQRELVAVVMAAVPSLESADQARPAQIVGRCGDGIDPRDFEYASNALLRTLKTVLGQEFSYDLWQAWIEALHTLAHVLITTAPMAAARRTA